jgi:hypothetical protein
MLLLALLLAAPAPCPAGPQLYIAPMGEPVRAPAEAPYPSAAWFGTADADRDGRVTLAEFVADADRFFARLDANRDGEIDPGEMTTYETTMAPEIRLYQPRPAGARVKRDRRSADYGGAQGAGRWAQLNLPQPVASADLDYNRGVSLAEWRIVAARRFALLGPVNGALTLATLKPTPAQDEATACLALAAKAAKAAKHRR